MMMREDDLLMHIEDDLAIGALPIRLHTPECDAQMTAQEAIYEAWEARYGVTCCKFCFQTGLELNVFAPDPSRPCWACIGQGRCPQCAGPFAHRRDGQCAACGWHEGVCKPDPPFCSCWCDGLSDEEIGEPPF